MINISEKKKRIAMNFKKHRKKNNLSRRKLSLWTKVSYGSLRRFEETGEISLDGFLRLAVFLGWSSEIYALETRECVPIGKIYYYTKEYLKNGYFDD